MYHLIFASYLLVYKVNANFWGIIALYGKIL